MDAKDRDFLRDHRHRITIGTSESGHLMVEFDDWDVYDATDDYLTEDCEEVLGEVWHYNKDGIWRIIFEDLRVTRAQVEELLARL